MKNAVLSHGLGKNGFSVGENMILTVCLSPCIDVSVELDKLKTGHTNVVKSKNLTFAGKALNTAIGIARLGGEPYATGFMYNENGNFFERALDKEGVPCTFVWNKGRVRENYKLIAGHVVTEINDVGEELGEHKTDELLSVVSPLSSRASVCVVSGGLPKGVSADYYESLFRAMDQNTIKIADAEGERLTAALRVGVDLVKPNLEELERTLGKEFEDEKAMLDGCKRLIQMGAKRVLLSLGERGAIITDGKISYRCQCPIVSVVSTVGAGDAMIAAAAIELEKGSSLDAILRASVAAGTATVVNEHAISFQKEKYDEIYERLTVSKIK